MLQDSKKRFQFLASLVVAVIVIIGFSIFTLMTRSFLYDDLMEQALKDNKVIGEAVLNIINRNRDQMKDSTSKNNLKNIVEDFHFACNEITLPNKGFICVARQNDGVLVAAPGLPFGKEADVKAIMVTTNRKNTVPIYLVSNKDTFSGYFESSADKTVSDIVVSIPYSKDYRLNVHQNAGEIRAKADKHTSIFLSLGAIIALGLSGFVYVAINKLTSRYESQIAIQNVALEKANTNLQESFDQISHQKKEIERQATDIQDSIQYGRRIQEAVLPTDQFLNQILNPNFVLLHPRNVVSGDFYWATQKDGHTIIAAVDCTGHGVPGAFMSMIGNTLLNQIINEHDVTEPDEILNRLHERIRNDLKQAESTNRDGMDITICTISPDQSTVCYAGANNPLWYRVGNGDLVEIKADKLAIGGYQDEEQRKFTKHIITPQTTTTFYLFSDGYPDQFGGENGRKMGGKRFKEVLDKISSLTITQQKEELLAFLDHWRQTPQKYFDQTDDILVIGFQVSPKS